MSGKNAKKRKPDYKTVYVPVVDGVAVLPDGRQISQVRTKEIAVPVLTKAGKKRLKMTCR